jgi:2-succinyl-5-enolpyruvyl-6-hydroxy-3-cyclohexene-1-carboxylate synthase
MANMEELWEPANPTYAYIGAFVDELQRAGVRDVVICPGSRSTPLAMAVAAQAGLRPWMHIDERSAAFFGLGMAKQLGRPVALICTSGTAAANFLPALIEAKLSHAPLLALTADRPPELRDCGAPQAIDQNRLYGSYVKWYVDVALPEATNTALCSIRTIACRAVALATAIPAGPVHLNFPLREPLTPEPVADQPLPPRDRRDPVAWHGRPDSRPYVTVSDRPLAGPSAAQVASLANLIRIYRRGLIVAGPAPNAALGGPLAQVARCLGYPILADPLSQLRSGGHDHDLILSGYDALLRAEHFVANAAPELVLRFGSVPTAKSLQLYMQRYAACQQVIIDGQGSWEEPAHLAAAMIHADPVALCADLVADLTPSAARGQVSRAMFDSGPQRPMYGRAPEPFASLVPTGTAADSGSWLAFWQRADEVARAAMREAMADFTDLFEGRIFLELGGLLPDGATLYVGNSMPVRDLETFFWRCDRRVRILGNRGANGIDGVLSSALGASAMARQGEPVVLVIGDLSFLHDLNGLLAARWHQLHLTIILVNNDGGGIFSFLPQVAYPDHFEQLFGTPTGLDFRPAVEMYGGRFQRIGTWEQFRVAVRQSLEAGGLQVIEVPTERASNVAMHRRLWRAVDEALQREL